MTRRFAHFASLFVAIQLLIVGGPLAAQQYTDTNQTGYGSVRSVATESWTEEWDSVAGEWVRVEDAQTSARANAQHVQTELPVVTSTYVNGRLVSETRSAARYAQPVSLSRQPAVLAQYGPFLVTGATTASMVGPTDAASPAHFDAMLRDFPQLARLDMVEAPGTSHDIANLQVGRRIRDAGIATHVPNGGSVRSGAVELFLAGATRTMEEGAQFAVHSWLDNHGREADDFAASHPAHRLYLDYYVEMGMSEEQARGFYAMTNSVPHSSALWLNAADMRPWLHEERAPAYRLAMQSAAPKSASAVAVVAALSEPALPVISVEPLELALVAVEKQVPTLNYTDVSGISLAKLDLVHAYAP